VLLAYLSVGRRTIWVRRGAESQVKRDFKATVVGRGRWRVRTEDACGPRVEKFAVRTVDKVRREDEPQPGDKVDFEDADCNQDSPATDSGCQPTPGGGSNRQKGEACKFCGPAPGKTCAATFKRIVETRRWGVPDCPKGQSVVLDILYTFRCD
jgi:hypothetical protein